MPTKKITFSELEQHNTKDDCWMAIHGKVYDVTKFLAEHPGGEEVMIEVAGMDASDAFEDIGHSNGARDMLAKYLIGELDGVPPKKQKKSGGAAGAGAGGGSITKVLVPVIMMAVIAFLVQKFM